MIRSHSEVPVTTNFMVTAHIRNQDYWAWAPHMDVIANDHYLDNRLVNSRAELSFAADATRGLAGGGPWMLMETSTSAVNWQPRNVAKAPREMIRNTLTHVARGADGISFFQWRASLQGSEKFHSAMLPHAGVDTKVWRESVELGLTLEKLAEVAGSRVVTDVALVFDWQAWWGADLDSHPTADIGYLDQVHDLYNALLAEGFTVDIVAPGASFDAHRLLVVPGLYLVSEADAARISDFAAAGGHVVISYFSGIVDENDRVRPGGYPGAFRELLGVSSEEFFPVDPAVTLQLSNGSTASTWTEWVHLRGAEAVTVFENGPLPGVPAVTRNSFGEGEAWYAATRLDAGALRGLVAVAARRAGVAVPTALPEGVELVRRRGAEQSYLFVINHTDSPFELDAAGTELITDDVVTGRLTVPAGEVRVVRETASIESATTESRTSL